MGVKKRDRPTNKRTKCCKTKKFHWQIKKKIVLLVVLVLLVLLVVLVVLVLLVLLILVLFVFLVVNVVVVVLLLLLLFSVSLSFKYLGSSWLSELFLKEKDIMPLIFAVSLTFWEQLIWKLLGTSWMVKQIQIQNLQISQQRSSDSWQIFLYFKCKFHNEGLPGEFLCF